jgi:hypothetical protein
MSTKLSLLVASLASLLAGCIKSGSNEVRSSTSDLISQAHSYFDKSIAGAGQPPNTANYRANQLRSVQWEAATVQHFSTGDAVIVPISYHNNLFVSQKAGPGLVYRLNDITSLVIARDSSNLFHAATFTFIPDTANRQNSPSGIYFVEDWQGNTIYTPVHLGPLNSHTNADASTSSNPKEVDFVQSIQVCNEIDGYNYSVDDPEGGIAWSETTCTTYGFAAQNPGPGIPLAGLGRLPISRYLPPLEVIIAPPTTPISNIADYFKCFTNSSSPDHTYSVQVCVDEPSPGTRQPWTLSPGGPSGTSASGNPLNAGHTFLVLTENDQGNLTSRNVGFYPATSVYPITGYTSAQGILNDDDGHQYNISLTINVSATQFLGILNYVSLGNNTGFSYDLNTDNCTTFVINALNTNGISLPNTKGSWTGGSGNDPGDLGEDISQMQLSPNMTRNTVSSPHPNVGTCN